MDKLWAPWRKKYIAGKKATGCIFCRKKAKLKENDFIVFKTKHSLCMLNIYPYNNGHLMVAPRRHVKDLFYLNDLELLDLMKAVNYSKSLLQKTLKPHGYNIGINISRAGGAGITGHLHIHIVPRWIGDTNFMPSVFGTKIISQSLKDLYKTLKDAQNN